MSTFVSVYNQYHVPNSIAHNPVPVPMSRTFWGFSPIGARNNFCSIVSLNRWCCKSTNQVSVAALELYTWQVYLIGLSQAFHALVVAFWGRLRLASSFGYAYSVKCQHTLPKMHAIQLTTIFIPMIRSPILKMISRNTRAQRLGDRLPRLSNQPLTVWHTSCFLTHHLRPQQQSHYRHL